MGEAATGREGKQGSGAREPAHGLANTARRARGMARFICTWPLFRRSGWVGHHSVSVAPPRRVPQGRRKGGAPVFRYERIESLRSVPVIREYRVL
jgi:hypothetical protein